MSQIKKGAALNYASIFLTNIIGLLLTPFIIKTLGKSEYGLYAMVGSLVASIAVLNLGLGNAVVRFTAKYRAEKDIKGQENFLATVLLLYIGISIIIVLVGLFLFFNLDLIYDKEFTETELYKTKVMFAILIFNLAITLPGSTFVSINNAYEHFVYPRSVDIVRYIVRSLAVVGVLLIGYGAIALVIIDTIMSISVKVANARYTFTKLNVQIKLHKWNKDLVLEIFGYTIWIFVFAVTSKLNWQAGQAILGAISGTEMVAVFSVGVTLGTYYGAFSTAISSVFLPRATKMFVKKATGEELTDMMIRIGRVSFIVLLYVLFAFILYGRQFVDLWVGNDYRNAWIIALLIMLAYTLPLVQNFGNSTLEAQNKLRFKAILYLSFAILGTILGAILAHQYGGIGMICGTVLGWVIVQIVMNVYYHKVIKLNMIRFFKELARKIVFCALAILAIGYGIDYLPGEGWFNFVAKGVLYSIVYCLLIYKFGMTQYEQNLFGNAVRSVKKKLKIFGE